jgi:hypothetical protein
VTFSTKTVQIVQPEWTNTFGKEPLPGALYRRRVNIPKIDAPSGSVFLKYRGRSEGFPHPDIGIRKQFLKTPW